MKKRSRDAQLSDENVDIINKRMKKGDTSELVADVKFATQADHTALMRIFTESPYLKHIRSDRIKKRIDARQVMYENSCILTFQRYLKVCCDILQLEKCFDLFISLS